MFDNVKPARYIVLLSGGLDSTILLCHCVHITQEVMALHINYGVCTMERELHAAQQVARMLSVPLYVLPLANSCPGWTGDGVTAGRVLLRSELHGDPMCATPVVPFRNAIILSLATGFALSNGFNTVALGVHKTDQVVFPDCRPYFLDCMEEAVFEGSGEQVQLYTPFIAKVAREVLQHGVELGAPFELTWSCYKPGVKHCGKCLACMKRRDAFKELNIADPTEYEDEDETVNEEAAASRNGG